MNKRRLIFLLVFGTYHLAALIFTVYMDLDNTILFSLIDKIGLFKWGALIGIVLFGTEVFWTWRDVKNAEREREAMRLENNTLKAKVYDLTEAAKKA
ncbi:MAG: hypothetical protein ACOVMQ_09995 [Cyclobacteriaceae bacterium]|jgi:hypothetical protein